MLRRLLGSFVLVACAAPSAPEPVVEAPAAAWRVLFDGVDLSGFEPTRFGGEGPVEVVDGRAVLDFGSPLSGITWRGDPLPKSDYEVELSAKRIAGSDFFCGLTFPVGDSFASLILGGWGGSLCGISSLDGHDASENETTSFLYLETGHDFRVRLRVTEARIQAWLDDAALVDVSIEGRAVSTRPEVDPSKPFGIASFATRASIGPIRVRSLAP